MRLYKLGRHYLLQADNSIGIYDGKFDANRLFAKFEPNINTLITDSPYGSNFDTNYTRFIGGLHTENNMPKVTNDNVPFNPELFNNYKNVIFCGYNHFANRLPKGSILVWDKRYRQQVKFLSDGEVAWLNSGEGTYIFNHYWNGFLRESERGKTLHPTQKPVALFEWFITKCKNPIDIVDPFAGVGACLLACENQGLRNFSIEIEENYVNIIIDRFEKLTGIKPVEMDL